MNPRGNPRGTHGGAPAVPCTAGSSWSLAAPPTATGGSAMDIDMNVLRGLESEKDISMDLVIKAIEDALLVAYQRTEGAAPVARVALDRQSGHVTVWAAETGPDGEIIREYDDTPSGFGRIAATTARQVILQRLRDAEDELTFGEYA